jgi:hypothetical protein
VTHLEVANVSELALLAHQGAADVEDCLNLPDIMIPYNLDIAAADMDLLSAALKQTVATMENVRTIIVRQVDLLTLSVKYKDGIPIPSSTPMVTRLEEMVARPGMIANLVAAFPRLTALKLEGADESATFRRSAEGEWSLQLHRKKAEKQASASLYADDEEEAT